MLSGLESHTECTLVEQRMQLRDDIKLQPHIINTFGIRLLFIFLKHHCCMQLEPTGAAAEFMYHAAVLVTKAVKPAAKRLQRLHAQYTSKQFMHRKVSG